MKRIPVYLLDVFKNQKTQEYISVPAGVLQKNPLTGRIMFSYADAYLKICNISIDPINLPLKKGGLILESMVRGQ